MKYLIYLLSALSLTFAIRVPSAWQQELQLGSLGRYEGIRPPRHGNQIKIQLPHVIVKTSQQKTRHRNPNRAYYSSPVNRNKHTPHFPKKFENTIIKSVLPKYVGHKKPYGYSKQKIPIYKKSIGQFPKQSPLVFYMTPNPKTVNVFTSTQPHIPHERAVHKFSISTSNLPFQNSEQLPENYINRQSQLERFGELPSFTTSIPPHHNVDGVFSKPTGFMTVESIQNKVDDHFLDKFSDELQPYNREYDGKNSEQDSDISSRYKSLESISNHKFENHLYKNYRDDKTQEPSLYDQDIDLEDLPKVHRDESEKGPISSHEIPGEIPTRPIYPGPGKWAKPGIKHKPFISRQKYETLGGNEEKPDGYDTFLEGEKLFNKLNGKFGENLQSFPEEHKLGKFLEKKTSNPINNKSNNKLEESQTEEGYDHEKDNDEFVPMRLYAQVRRSEDTKHFPADG
ncbi:hypothetical protein JTB14_024826 [Gonioctena quinquepunctata]|nr:hypothetical protein JTB14_024826 [Gonioctena quinquepunctata]